MLRCFQEYLHVKSSTDIHQELRKSRIEKDNQGVTVLVYILKGSFIHPFAENMRLVSISKCLEATERVSRDLLQAKTLGHKVLQKFINERILTTTVDFYEPVKKLKLSTFKDLVKVFKISLKDRMIPLKYHRELFTQIMIIMQKRIVDLKEVLSFPLGPLLWALAGIIGDLKKANKASSLHRIEGNALPLEHIPAQSTGIFDGMAEVRSFKVTGLTFGELANELFRSIISKGC